MQQLPLESNKGQIINSSTSKREQFPSEEGVVVRAKVANMATLLQSCCY